MEGHAGVTAGAGDTFVPAAGGLPEYTLRVSARARQVRLKISPREGLVVVVPKRLRGYDPADALRSRRDWIDSTLAHFAERRAALIASPDALLPDEVAFPATGERWPVEYRSTTAASVRARVVGGLLVVLGDVDDAEACLAALRRWLHAAAAPRLLALLAEESARTGLPYRKGSVRAQRSRWGGCSSSGSITLNRALLFLPPELARGVVLHELAHLKVPNHSPAFWHFLVRLDPEAHNHRAAIKLSWDAVPPWAEP